jgi:hypothetical protein
MEVRESYAAKAMTADGAILSRAGQLGGFLCTHDGSIKLTTAAAGAGTVILDTFAVLAGTFYPLPFAFDSAVYVTFGAGAAGTFAVGF